jgi:hypothetical protein
VCMSVCVCVCMSMCVCVAGGGRGEGKGRVWCVWWGVVCVCVFHLAPMPTDSLPLHTAGSPQQEVA